MVRLVHDGPSPERLRADDEALAWVVRLTSGEATPEDHARFRNWRDASAENAEALVRARTLWNTLGSTLPEIERKRERALARWRRVGRALPIAASLVIAIGLGNQYRQVWQYDAVTGTGEHRSIVLADGSKVVLGADAALSDHYNGVERRLTLARGQAFFQVRHDARRPFIVQTDQGEVRDVGTAFTIALADDRTRVLVVDGIVEASDGRHRLRLTANQAIDISTSGLGTVSSAEAGIGTAWMRRKLLLSNRPLGEIVEAMAPYCPRRIVLLNHAVADMPMSAAMDLDEKGVDEWLTALGRSGAVRLTRLPGVIIIT